MKRWLLGLPMYATCAPADYRQLMRQIVDGLNAAGWNEPVDMPDEVDDLHAFWRSDRLLLGQACGYPLMTSLAGEVRLLGTPHYDFPGCDGYRYCSFIVVAEEARAQSLGDLRGMRAAYNQPDSQSGMNALRHAVAAMARQGRFFSSVTASGSHRASLQMVKAGQADVAAVDCITHGYLALHEPHLLEGLRVLCATPPMPGLPLISSPSLDAEAATLLREVLSQVLAPDGTDTPASRLRLAGFTRTQLADYRGILDARSRAWDFGYHELA